VQRQLYGINSSVAEALGSPEGLEAVLRAARAAATPPPSSGRRLTLQLYGTSERDGAIILRAEYHDPSDSQAYQTQLLFVRCAEGFGADRLEDVLRALSLVLDFELRERASGSAPP